MKKKIKLGICSFYVLIFNQYIFTMKKVIFNNTLYLDLKSNSDNFE